MLNDIISGLCVFVYFAFIIDLSLFADPTDLEPLSIKGVLFTQTIKPGL